MHPPAHQSGRPRQVRIQNFQIWTALVLADIELTSRISAARRAFSLAFSITQRDVVPSAEPDADRKPCAVWLD
jgi:hypothetical protein